MPGLPSRIGRRFQELEKVVIRVDLRHESRFTSKLNTKVFRRPKTVVVKLENMADLRLRRRIPFPKLEIHFIKDGLRHETSVSTTIQKCNKLALRSLCLWIVMLFPITAIGIYMNKQFDVYDRMFQYIQRGKIIDGLKVAFVPEGLSVSFTTDNQEKYAETIPDINKKNYRLLTKTGCNPLVTYNKDDDMSVIRIGFTKISKD